MAFKTLQELQQYVNPCRRHSDLSPCIYILNEANEHRTYLRVSKNQMSECWPEIRVAYWCPVRSMSSAVSVGPTAKLWVGAQISVLPSQFKIHFKHVTAKSLTTCCILTTDQFPPRYCFQFPVLGTERKCLRLFRIYIQNLKNEKTTGHVT